MKVKVLQTSNLKGIKSRTGVDGQVQYYAYQILQKLSSSRPQNAYCILGATMFDLYPRETDKSIRAGVFSFARYDPSFYGEPKPAPDLYRSRLLMSCVKVITHETGHLFGMSHCVFYKCAMNGSMTHEEARSRPVDLCPICLRKM